MQERILPIKNVEIHAVIPPDKSVSHRALLFGAIANGTTEITNPLFSEDITATADCVRRLGAKVEFGAVWRVTGAESFNSADLYAANSGTTMRLITGLLAAQKGREFILTGDGSLSKRPMKRVCEPLGLMGAQIETTGGFAPLRIRGAGLCGITYKMPVDSAQVKSAILLAGLFSDGETTVIENIPSRDHTELMLKVMGADIKTTSKNITVKRSNLKAARISVPGDISSAAFFIVAAAAKKGGYAYLKNVGINPTRAGIIEVLGQCGTDYKLHNIQNISGEPTADIAVTGGKLKPFKITRELVPSLIDEIPALCVLAAFADGVSVIEGAEELKVKESNRIDTVVDALKKMGADIEATSGGMIIRGKNQLKGGAVIDSKGDHRIAMSMAVAAMLSEEGGLIEGAECAAVSFPDFFNIIKKHQ